MVTAACGNLPDSDESYRMARECELPAGHQGPHRATVEWGDQAAPLADCTDPGAVLEWLGPRSWEGKTP